MFDQEALSVIDGIPSTPEAPLLSRTRCHARTRFSRSHTSSINCIVAAGLSDSVTATTGSTPGTPVIGASPLAATPTRRREQINLQVALVNALMHAKGHAPVSGKTLSAIVARPAKAMSLLGS